MKANWHQYPICNLIVLDVVLKGATINVPNVMMTYYWAHRLKKIYLYGLEIMC